MPEQHTENTPRRFLSTLSGYIQPLWQDLQTDYQLLKRRVAMMKYRANANYGSTPLHEAAKEGDTEAVQELLATGANVNSANDIGFTPLCWAVIHGHTETVHVLLAAGADVNAPSGLISSDTPLHIAADYGYTALVHVLLAAGADVNAKDSAGRIPLRYAVEKAHLSNTRGHHLSTIQALLTAGSNVNFNVGLFVDVNVTLLHWAAKWGYTELVQPLIAAGINVNTKNNLGRTPLWYAVFNKHTETVQALLAAGADVNINVDGIDIPLHNAIQWSNTETALALIAAGADVNAKDSNGYTPLHTAARMKRPNMIPHLLKAGSNPAAQTKSNETALRLAENSGSVECIEILRTAPGPN